MITLILVIPSLLTCESLCSDHSKYEDYRLLEYDTLPRFDQELKMDDGRQQGNLLSAFSTQSHNNWVGQNF